MSTTLFVRSYPDDFEWLKYSVLSMKKYLTGYDKSVLVLPHDSPKPKEAEFFDEVRLSNRSGVKGYIAQQLDKLECYQYIDTEHVFFVDCDNIFKGPYDINKIWFKDGLPILYMSKYTQLTPAPDDIAASIAVATGVKIDKRKYGLHWQDVVEKYMGIRPEYEYMRIIPLIHRTASIQACTEAYPHLVSKAHLVDNNDYSEFNFIGTYAHLCEHPYYFTDIIPPLPAKNFWSYGGFTPEIMSQIEEWLTS